jgi:hypothetical protein
VSRLAGPSRLPFVSWRAAVHRRQPRNGKKTLCGLTIPSPVKVGPVGYFERVTPFHHCIHCRRKENR